MEALETALADEEATTVPKLRLQSLLQEPSDGVIGAAGRRRGT
jgi:hypothetical protein